MVFLILWRWFGVILEVEVVVIVIYIIKRIVFFRIFSVLDIELNVEYFLRICRLFFSRFK